MTAWLDSPEPCELRLEASIAGSSSKLGSASRLVSIPAGKSCELLELEAEGAEPWWPVGYGEQPLYDLELRAGDDTE